LRNSARDVEGGKTEYDVRESSTAAGTEEIRDSRVDCGIGSEYFEVRESLFWHAANEMVLSSPGREEKISHAMYCVSCQMLHPAQLRATDS
jgi:hypothetical protein